MRQLTRRGVTTLCRQQVLGEERITVEASNIKFKPQDLLCFEVSDGEEKINAFVNLKEQPELDITKVGKGLGSGRYLIVIKEHNCHEYGERKVVEVIKLQKEISSEKTFSSEPQNQAIKALKNKKKIECQEMEKGGQNCEFGQANQNTRGGLYESEQSSGQKKMQMITESQLLQFEKISDLYVDFQHWEIIVRLLDFSYKQFSSKQGKMIKLLTLELVDRTGMKIEASLFGEEARFQSQRIKKGSVYRVSGGQIKQHFYSQSMANDYSKLNIILSKASQLTQICDIASIPRGREHMMTLSEVLEDLNYQRYYQILVVLLHIGEYRELQKQGGKKVFKRSLLVGDPETRKSVQCILWTKYMNIDEKWLYRSLLLKSFRLNNYKDQLSLSSVFRSDIQLLESSRFSVFESYVKDIQFWEVNSKKIVGNQCLMEQKSQIRTIKELESELTFLAPMDTITSELQVWITFIKFQGKWCYGACNNPKCKRATDSFNRCVHCGTYNEQVIKKYMLPIELTDFTGSLWTTAFDDFANEIFKGYRLQDFEGLHEGGQKELADRQLYQQFRVRLSTKKQSEGVFRHAVMGRPVEINTEEALRSNIQKIVRAIE